MTRPGFEGRRGGKPATNRLSYGTAWSSSYSRNFAALIVQNIPPISPYSESSIIIIIIIITIVTVLIIVFSLEELHFTKHAEKM
jgi:hypothetical protein